MATIAFKKPKKERTAHSEFKAVCKKYLRQRFGKNFFCLDIAGGAFQKSGSPDTLCTIYGQFFAFEWKQEGDREGPKQVEMIDAIRAAGGRAYFIWSLRDLAKAVSDLPAVQLSIV